MYGQTPLFSANAETAQILVDAGADVNVRDYEGLSALFVASVFNDDDSVKKLSCYADTGPHLPLTNKGNWHLQNKSSTSSCRTRL